MRGTQAKKLRRVARKMCDPKLTHMQGRKYKVKAQHVLDKNGKPVIDIRTGLPIVIPEHYNITAFWPNGSYRRLLASMKRLYHRDPQQKMLMLEMGERV